MEDGSRHAGGSAPQGRAEPLCPVPCPGSRAPPPPAAEVTLEVGRPLLVSRPPHPQTLLPFWEVVAAPRPALSTPTSPAGLSELFLRNFQPLWNSRRRSPAWWTVGSPLPLPTLHPDGGACPGSEHPAASGPSHPTQPVCGEDLGGTQTLPATHPLFSLSRLRGPTETPVASGAPTPAFPGPAAQARWA